MPLSRLSFTVYLNHLVIIYLRHFTGTSTRSWNNADFVSFINIEFQVLLNLILFIVIQLCNALVHYVLSNFVAYFIYVTFEAPFCNLEKVLFSRRTKINEDSHKIKTTHFKNKNHLNCVQSNNNQTHDNNNVLGLYIIRL